MQRARCDDRGRELAGILAVTAGTWIALVVLGVVTVLLRGDADGPLFARASAAAGVGAVLLATGLVWRARHPGQPLLATPRTLAELSTEWGIEEAFLVACADLDGFPEPLADGRYDEADVTLFLRRQAPSGPKRFTHGVEAVEQRLRQPAWLDRRSEAVARARDRALTGRKASQAGAAVLILASVATVLVPDRWSWLVLLVVPIVLVVAITLGVRANAAQQQFEAAVQDVAPRPEA